MKTIRTFIAITFTLGFLLACGGGGSSSGGTSYNVTGGWAGIYREELSGGSIFCQFNINGNRKKFEGYNADITADLALDYLKRVGKKRFYLQVGFKAVHYPFQPAKRHHGRYDKFKVPFPQTMSLTERNYETQPNWVRERRYGIHGIDHMETGPLDNDPVPSFPGLYRRFAETVHGLDENVGRILDYLDASGLAKDTLVLYLGDNGFALGEHGFYDKRDAFEESIRIPMLAYAPGRIRPGTKVNRMTLNIDMAQTVLAAMEVAQPDGSCAARS